MWLDYALEVLLTVVKNQVKSKSEFSVHWPTEGEMKASADNLTNNPPNGGLLRGVFAVVDGGRIIPCASYLEPDLRNGYDNGYTGEVEVFGTFSGNYSCRVNLPGSWHDIMLSIAR